jgi:flagellar basal-body rod protein FlgC
MSLDRALDISLSAILAEREHMEVISSNIANINTTNSIGGGPYRRKIAVFQEKPLSFQEVLEKEVTKTGGGVEIADVVEDPSSFQKVYNPSHPDADKDGLVSLPNVDLSKEMVDLVYSSKLYEININVFTTTRKMVQDTLTLPIER